jgi:hypothetical protein
MWQTLSCGKHKHRVFFQTKGYSCVIACMLMALDRKNLLSNVGVTYRKKHKVKPVHKPITGPEMRAASQEYGGSGRYRPGVEDVPGAQTWNQYQSQLAKITTQALGSRGAGTYLSSVPRTLRALGVTAYYYTGVSRDEILWYAQNFVCIGRVYLKAGSETGYHAILIENVTMAKVETKGKGKGKGKGKTGTGKKETKPVSFCVCDPASGPVNVKVPPKSIMPVWKASGVSCKLMNEAVLL